MRVLPSLTASTAQFWYCYLEMTYSVVFWHVLKNSTANRNCVTSQALTGGGELYPYKIIGCTHLCAPPPYFMLTLPKAQRALWCASVYVSGNAASKLHNKTDFKKTNDASRHKIIYNAVVHVYGTQQETKLSSPTISNNVRKAVWRKKQLIYNSYSHSVKHGRSPPVAAILIFLLRVSNFSASVISVKCVVRIYSVT